MELKNFKDLYFKNIITTITTFLLIALITFIAATIYYNDYVVLWEVRTSICVVVGFFICCTATLRDGYINEVKHSIDKSCAPGIFELKSIPNNAGYIGAFLIVISTIATIIFKTDELRQIFFYVLAFGIALKISVIEISRIRLCIKNAKQLANKKRM